MSEFNWCHGPQCHEKHTVDRVRGVKGSKVLRTRKIKITNYNERYWFSYFCSQQCYDNFANKYIKEDKMINIVNQLYRVVPPILSSTGKVKNPWPNVDAQSGVIQWHYGIQEYDFYTVLFGIGRSIGVLSNIIWDRALGYPIERPKSLTTDMLEEIAKKAKEEQVEHHT